MPLWRKTTQWALPRFIEEKQPSSTTWPLWAAGSRRGWLPFVLRAKQSTSGTCSVLLGRRYRYRMCSKYQLCAHLPPTVCGPSLFQWMKPLSWMGYCHWKTTNSSSNVNNTACLFMNFTVWTSCAANKSTCHSAYGGSLGLSVILSWEQQWYISEKKYSALFSLAVLKNPTKRKKFSHFSKADFLYLRYWVIAEKTKKKMVRYISITSDTFCYRLRRKGTIM